MKRMLFRAASKLMLEIVKERNLEKITPFFDYLNSSFSYEEAMCIVEDVANSIYAKNKDLYNWLVNRISDGSFDEYIDDGTLYLNIYDLVHVLLDDGRLPGVDFIGHPFDPDKIMSTQETYSSLVDIFGEECIDQMVEVGSVS